MSRKKWWIIGLAVLALLICAVPVVVVVFYLYGPPLLNPSMPVYDYQVVPSTQVGYSRHTLRLRDKVYESDYTEYALASPGNDQQIGQTSWGGRLYRIYGQEDFFVLYDFMSPLAVFRDSQKLEFDLGTADVTDMQLSPLESGPQKNTKDSHLIQDVVTTITEGTPITSVVSGSLDTYCLYLSGGKLVGMTYCAGVYMDKTGQVFLARDTISKEWFQASPLFEKWAKTP